MMISTNPGKAHGSAADGQALHPRRVAQADAAPPTRQFRSFTFRAFSLEAAWREAERITRGAEGELNAGG